jgi:hypothetical protein
MLVKINKQPIEVVVPDEESEGINWIYLCVSTIGFMSILSLLDYISYIFVGIHALPFMHTITKFILHLIGA